MNEAQSDVGNYVVPSADATSVNLGNLADFGVKKNDPMANIEKHFEELKDTEVIGPLKRVSLNSDLVDPSQFEERKKAPNESRRNEGLFLERLFRRRESKDAA